MAFTNQDMEKVLKKYAGFGYLIYYLYIKDFITTSEVNLIFSSLNPEKAELYLNNILLRVSEKHMEDAVNYAKENYSVTTCINDYFNLSSEYITLKADVYETALNFVYTSYMLESLKNKNSNNRILEKYKVVLDKMILESKKCVVYPLSIKKKTKEASINT